MEALLYFLFWAVFLFVMMRFGCGSHIMGRHGHGHPKTGGKQDEQGRSMTDLRWIPPETDIDPVCGKSVRTEIGKSSVHDGTVFYFCSRECREVFEVAPDQYAGKSVNANDLETKNA